MRRHAIWLALVTCAAGCYDGEERSPVAGSTDAGPEDPAEVAACLACHQNKLEAWAKPSSHSLLFYCSTCHVERSAEPGPGHVVIPECNRCHSEKAHPTGTSQCTSCHTPHGSSNAFLIRENVLHPDGATAPVHVTKPEGQTDDGLVHPGAKKGSGLCETCHTKTAHYTSSGGGTDHFTLHCTKCHDHQKGFARP